MDISETAASCAYPSAAEALIVAERRGVQSEMAELISRLGLAIETADVSTAPGVARAYRVWGKGHAPSALNFGDCFAYQLARQRNCPLLFVGNDFARTDIVPAGRATTD